MTTRFALAGVLLTLVTGAGIGCRPPDRAPLLVPADDAVLAPTVTRIPVALDEDQREFFESGKVPIAFDRYSTMLQHYVYQRTKVMSFTGTTTPFEDFVYDASHDRFIVPGHTAVSRTGELTFDPPPLVAPPGLRPRLSAEMREAFHDRRMCEVTVAVRIQPDFITALCTIVAVETYNRHRRGRRYYPDMIDWGQMNASSFKADYGSKSHSLPLAPGWDSWSSVEHFLESGELVIGVETSSWLGPPIRGSRYATVRIDRRGEREVIHRGRWQSARVTRQGEVVGVVRRAGRGVLLGLDRDGKQRFREVLDESAVVASHAEGVCTLERSHAGTSGTLSCFDRDGELQWRRFAPYLAGGWLVADDGWNYFFDDFPNTRRAILVAVNPEGMIAWRLPVDPPVTYLHVAGDDLCFVVYPPGLVCIGPRHGQPVADGDGA
jgi:hypothetical protein